nr:glycosyltransferase [Psychrobacter sp. JCM 18901]
MAAAYNWADIIVCRAGALTVTEIQNVGIAAIFVPLPHAVDDHQTANARTLTSHDAAILLRSQS